MPNSTFFQKALRDRNNSGRHRRWLFVPYDQLSSEIGPLALEEPRELGIILIENRWKAARRPYHKQKLALVLANMRHFALEQAARGVAIQYLSGNAPYADLLAPLAKQLGPLRVMRPAERELRADLQTLFSCGALSELPHQGWLTAHEQFHKSHSGPPWRMDSFYRYIRRESGILMAGGKPLGGKFSFDQENRLAWSGHPPAPDLPQFLPDEITREVCELIQSRFSHHPGDLNPDLLPATHSDAQKLWSWAKHECLPHFGPFEDAMSRHAKTLFHTRLSQLLNLHRLLPRSIVADVILLDIPVESKEGFIRQILGWREFMHHVHEASDGFRQLPQATPPIQTHPSDAGFSRWSSNPWPASLNTNPVIDGGAAPSFLGAANPLPPAFWGRPSGFHCLDTVIREVWQGAYGHHITRLMVLSNLATLLDISPRELCDWFWVAYADAYDWVVEPNVLGMGTFALGGLFTTKPYVSGSAYIHRMGDYCEACSFDPKRDCPFTSLYWAFLERHKKSLHKNIRLAMPYRSLENRSRLQKKQDSQTFVQISSALRRGDTLSPSQSVLLPAQADSPTPRAKIKGVVRKGRPVS